MASRKSLQAQRTVTALGLSGGNLPPAGESPGRVDVIPIGFAYKGAPLVSVGLWGHWADRRPCAHASARFDIEGAKALRKALGLAIRDAERAAKEEV